MKKRFLIAASAIVAVSAGVFAYLNSEIKTDDLFSANVEALARNEGVSGCTGPKRSNLYGQIMCKCKNDVPCMDDRGCN